MQQVMLVVSAPVDHADRLRNALASAGAGKMGNYSHCSFSYHGVGRFLPEEGSNPAYGTVGKLEALEEERIEILCEKEQLPKIIEALKASHPYEEPAFHYFSVDTDL